MIRRSVVASVAFEHPDSGKFDDVVTHYAAGHYRSTLATERDGAQLKYHVVAGDALRWSSFTDPAVLGSQSNTSLVEAVVEAYRAHPAGLFTFVTTWPLDPSDNLCESHRGDDSRLRLDKLFDAKRGELAQVRTKMMALATADEGTLRGGLSRVVLQPALRMDRLTGALDIELSGVGLPTIDDRLGAAYDTTPFAYLKHGRINWDASTLKNILRTEFGWAPSTSEQPHRRRVALRQFIRFAEYLEDGTDAFLDLLERFVEREPAAGEDWNRTILPAVRDFVRAEVENYGEVELRVAVSLSVAFLIGASIRPKAPVHLFVEQSGGGKRAAWDTAVDVDEAEGLWEIRTVERSAETPDFAVSISITHDAVGDVDSWTREADVRVMKITDFRVPNLGPAAIRDDRHAAALARSFLRQLPEVPRGGTLHLFPAGPAGFVVALGRLAQHLPRVQLYEFNFESRFTKREYRPSFLIDRTEAF